MSVQEAIYSILCFRNYSLEVVEYNKCEKRLEVEFLEKIIIVNDTSQKMMKV